MKGKMSPQERMGAVLMGQKPDRAPVIPFVQAYAAGVLKMPYYDFWSDGDKYFEANFASMRLHGYDQTPIFGYAACGPWELGGKVGMPKDPGVTAPYLIEPPVKSIEDVEKLQVPSFNGALPGAYAIAERVAQRCIELGMPAGFQAGSVFTAAAQIADTSTFLTWTITNPDVVHLLMEKVSDMYINALEYFANKFGPQNCLPFQAGPMEAKGMLSPEKFKEFVHPYNLKINKKIRDLGIIAVLMHPCADQNDNIPYYREMREECGWHGRYIWLFGPETGTEKLMETLGERDVICGSVDPVAIHERPYEEVLELCKNVLEIGKNNPGGFILTCGCEFPAEAAPVKIMAMMDAADQFGRYE